MANNPRFHQLVADAKTHIRETTPQEAQQRPANVLLIDVREGEDYRNEHAEGAVHLSRGILEWKIEEVAPDLSRPIICYCGGGSRSALAAESLQKMGYTNVESMAGGFRAWREQGLPTSS
jgi:rhodanese-related sulfurtransferase